ncbi:LysR substrate-binding domain-containing protein [Pararhodospirillum oryzae]|uniref:LysR family transcriptional regulator n=1 Tax=Pararhodospirillum oryzae TaxID=478448 RepID=A0A512H686_9PROT|nr:LysR substrate-binding domain-containing protein [Pararhodospirillum oryzae]GEO80938.1 LysR family transcriptional regulator [Pararhodospirillum oryzae]
MRFDLTDLRLFLAVIEAGSITQGAARAGLSLAAASARVRGLEARLGVPLLERGRRGIEPTAAGRTLATHARGIVRQAVVLQGEMTEHAQGLGGAVRLLANTAALATFLPEALGRLLAAHPDLCLELEERPSPAIVHAVLEERADLGVIADSADPTGLEATVLGPDPLALAVPLSHPLASAPGVWFADVLNEGFIGLRHDSALHQLLAGHALRHGAVLRFRARLPALDGVLRMVALGAGVAVVPAAARPASLPVVLVGLRDAWAGRHLLLVTRRSQALARPARLVHAAVREAFSGPV